MPVWVLILGALLALYLAWLLLSARRARAWDQASERAGRAYYAKHQYDETWSFYAYPHGSNLPSAIWVTVARTPEGNIEITSIYPQLDPYFALLFTRQQQRAGEPLWWPSRADVMKNKIRLPMASWTTSGWSYRGLGQGNDDMLINYEYPEL